MSKLKHVQLYENFQSEKTGHSLYGLITLEEGGGIGLFTPQDIQRFKDNHEEEFSSGLYHRIVEIPFDNESKFVVYKDGSFTAMDGSVDPYEIADFVFDREGLNDNTTDNETGRHTGNHEYEIAILLKLVHRGMFIGMGPDSEEAYWDI
jgi:hypothetical protein